MTEPTTSTAAAAGGDPALGRFLAHLHRGGAWAYWWTSGDKRSYWWPVGQPLPRPNGRANVYFGVHPTGQAGGAGERSKNATIAAVNCLFAEFDAKDFDGDKAATLAHVNGLSPAPSIVIDSGGGYHAYWLLADPFLIAGDGDRERARAIQAGWVALVGGDDGAKDLARVLRVPGTVNYKYDPGRPVSFVKADLDCLYALGDLETMIPRPAARPTAAPASARPVAQVGDRRRAAWATAALDGELAELRQATEGDRNKQLNRSGFALGQLVGAGALDRSEVEAQLTAVALMIGLGERETQRTIKESLDAGEREPRAIPDRDLAQGLAGGGPPPESDPGPIEAPPMASGQAPAASSWPYAIKGGRLVYQVARGDNGAGEPEITDVPICDFRASIAEETTTEEGERLYRITGQAIRNGGFSVELTADDYSDDRKLKAALDAAAGARDPIRAGMVKHLGPAIKLLTGPELVRTKRYHRTGWADGRFLLPGREPAGVDIQLPRKLPYGLAGDGGDVAQGLQALESLICAMGPERGAVAVAFAFQAAMAEPAGWRNERYSLFISGRTGSLKTAFAQVLVSIYGQGFLHDALLIKWGEGATRNAIMALATHAHDLPILIDNFKPSTGGGRADFVNLIHNILEGGEKDRLNRAAQLRESRPVFCWPLVTGEDVPDRDPSTLARILVLPFAWQQGEPNPQLSQAQELGAHLSAVGAAWLAWLESEAGQAAARRRGAQLADMRGQWAEYLRGRRADMVNILRVASNLASNQLTWWAMEDSPILGELARRYENAHRQGLAIIAQGMAEQTAEALEAVRFVDGLRQLLAAGRALLLDSTTQPQPANDLDRDRFVGWQDGDGGAYLIPDVAKEKAERLLGGPAALGYLSDHALYAQLDQLKWIASHDQGRLTKVIRVGSPSGKTTTIRTLHVAAAALAEQESLPG